MTSQAQVAQLYAGVSSTLTVATFTTSVPPEGSNPVTALVNWGDGTESNGTVYVTDGGSKYTVQGDHAYATDSLDKAGGAYQVTVTLTIPNFETLSSIQAVSVAQPPLTAFGNEVYARAGEQYVGNVATLVEPNTSWNGEAFSAIIYWGDGTSSSGIVTGAAGLFQVRGSHTYETNGKFHFQVQVTDKSDSIASQFYIWLFGEQNALPGSELGGYSAMTTPPSRYKTFPPLQLRAGSKDSDSGVFSWDISIPDPKNQQAIAKIMFTPSSPLN